jgi:hypothetical protein
MPGIMFDQNGNVANFNPDGGNVLPMQKLASGFQGLDAAGNPVPINPGRWNRGEVTVSVHGGTLRFQQGGAPTGLVDGRPQRFRAEDLRPVDTGMVGSARAASGRPLAASELKPDSLVEITLSDGTTTRTTVAAAQRLGGIRQTANGYENVDAPAQQNPSAPQNVQPQVDHYATDVPVDEEFVGHVAVLQRGLPEVFVANAVSEIVKNGAISPEAIHAAARHLDSTPDAVLAVMQDALKAHGASFERYAAANGVRPADLTEWMQTH